MFMLVLKDILGGYLKITPENSNNLARQKIASKESLGMLPRTGSSTWIAGTFLGDAPEQFKSWYV